MTINACDKCEKPIYKKNDCTNFGQNYDLDAKTKVLKQKVKITISFNKNCGELGELCDPCATILFKEAVKGCWWDWTAKRN